MGFGEKIRRVGEKFWEREIQGEKGLETEQKEMEMAGKKFQHDIKHQVK